MAKVVARIREKLPPSAFADPTDRMFLIHDETHARLSMQLMDRHAWPDAERKAVAKARTTAALQRFGVDLTQLAAHGRALPDVTAMDLDCLSALHGMMENDFSASFTAFKADHAVTDDYSADLSEFLPTLTDIAQPDDVEAGEGCTADVLEDRFLKIAVARLGVWAHPAYGVVVFSQDDFDQMLSNFENDELGFPPFARYGHDAGIQAADPDSGVIVKDDDPSRGQIVGLAQEGPILFSYVRPDDDEMADHVAARRMNYSSAEVYRKVDSKLTGKPIGTVLKAIALTNTPFVPNLPANQVLSQPEVKPKVKTMLDKLAQLFTQGLALLNGETVTQTPETAKTEENVAETLTSDVTVPDDSNKGVESSLTDEAAGAEAAESNATLETVTVTPEQELIAPAEGNSDHHQDDPVGEKTPEENTMTEQDPAQKNLIEELSNRLNALEASNTDLVEKFSNSMTENEQLKADLTATKAILEVTKNTAEMFSNNLVAEKRSQLQTELAAEGIPPAMIAQAFSFAAAMGTNEMKLSDGAVASVDDQIAVMLRALPKEQRIQFGQAGQQFSTGAASTETATSLYGEFMKKPNA